MTIFSPLYVTYIHIFSTQFFQINSTKLSFHVFSVPTHFLSLLRMNQNHEKCADLYPKSLTANVFDYSEHSIIKT